MTPNQHTQLIDAAGHLGAALVQIAPSDDKIIVGHMRDAQEILLRVLKANRPEPTYRTSLQLALAELANACCAMEAERIALARFVNDEDPDDLRALADLATRAAKAMDELFAEIALQAGLPRLGYVEEVANLVHDDLANEIVRRANKMEAEREETEPRFDPAREWGTLNKAQQGIA